MTVHVYKAFSYAVTRGQDDEEVLAVKVVARADSPDGTGMTDLSLGVRTNGQRHLVGPRALTSSKSNETLLLQTNPVTGGNWSPSEINPLQLSLYVPSPPVTALAQDGVVIWSNQECPSAVRVTDGEGIGKLYIPFHVDKATTVRQFLVWNGAQVAGSFDVGIYNRTTWSRIVSSGSTVQAGTNQLQAVQITETVLQPGRYYMAIASDANGAQFKVWRDAQGAQILSRIAGVKQGSVFPLPLNETLTDVSSIWAQVPAVALI